MPLTKLLDGCTGEQNQSGGKRRLNVKVQDRIMTLFLLSKCTDRTSIHNKNRDKLSCKWIELFGNSTCVVVVHL